MIKRKMNKKKTNGSMANMWYIVNRWEAHAQFLASDQDPHSPHFHRAASEHESSGVANPPQKGIINVNKKIFKKSKSQIIEMIRQELSLPTEVDN